MVNTDKANSVSKASTIECDFAETLFMMASRVRSIVVDMWASINWKASMNNAKRPTGSMTEVRMPQLSQPGLEIRRVERAGSGAAAGWPHRLHRRIELGISKA
jgi:hypothetical protein